MAKYEYKLCDGLISNALYSTKLAKLSPKK